MRQAAARMRIPALSYAYRRWRVNARAEAKEGVEAQQHAAARRFAVLKRQCEEVQRELADRDAQSTMVRRRLENAIAASREGEEEGGEE